MGAYIPYIERKGSCLLKSSLDYISVNFYGFKKVVYCWTWSRISDRLLTET